MKQRYAVALNDDYLIDWIINQPTLRANGVPIEDLGDGRVSFGETAMLWFREDFTHNDDGFVEDGDDGGPAMWIGGDPYPVVTIPQD
jgi:hypothetical protein